MGCPECERLGIESLWHQPELFDLCGSGPEDGCDCDDYAIEEFSDTAWEYYAQAHDLLVKKQISYGPLNISAAPGGPLNGLMVRMHDKMERLKHIVYNGGEDTVGEAITDTVQDLMNYCVIFQMIESGDWPTGGDQ